MNYEEFFAKATGGKLAYPYQSRLATVPHWPHLLSVPTGVGKTAAVVLGWLYRRRFSTTAMRDRTPRRLAYCLPVRNLVEQTRDNVCEWLQNLGLDSGDDKILHSVLMGGEDHGGWDEYPEQDAVLIGTQDMLLSRALNRGYGMSRYRWPIHFAFLNNDCQWVLDETQLMGVGVTTAAQLAGFRESLRTFGSTQTLWMSATLDFTKIETVDHRRPDSGWIVEELDHTDKAAESIQQLIRAPKHCEQASTVLTSESLKRGYFSDLACEIAEAHQPGALTLVVVNQVERAQNTYRALESQLRAEQSAVELCLVHSRFRPFERDSQQHSALDEQSVPASGRIVVTTQAIEAGVDVSATTLFTELAPWSSLVQRFGRCNRRGTCGLGGTPAARILWIDIDTHESQRTKPRVLPYTSEDLDRARETLRQFRDVGPENLVDRQVDQSASLVHVIRRKDLLDLFDTTTDLSGNDLDISRYIRDTDENDILVYWRAWEIDSRGSDWCPPDPRATSGNAPFSAPQRRELCAVSIGRFRDFAQKLRKQQPTRHVLWQWDPLVQEWDQVDPARLHPGAIILLHSSAGGYDEALGWTGDPTHGPVSPCIEDSHSQLAGMDDDDTGTQPIRLSEHLDDVADAAEQLRGQLEIQQVPWKSIIRAASWHDVGKAHRAFQTVMRDSEAVETCDPEHQELWAKSGRSGFPRYRIPREGHEQRDTSRRGFRHELASALAWLAIHDSEPDTDLVAYLIAAHHGKVRMNLRSMPNENRPPDPATLFARGVWHGDLIPSVRINTDPPEITRPIELSLEPMALGEDSCGRPSWMSRMLALRDHYGPFRLAWMEAIVRVADWRGSSKEPTP